MTKHRYKGLICGLILLLPGLAATARAVDEVVIVKSSDNTYFNQSIETLLDHAVTGSAFKTVMLAELSRELGNGNADRLFVTLGQPAFEAVARLDGRQAVIGAYLTREQFDRLDPGNQSVVLLDQPLYRYLAFCRLLLSVESVGLIEDAEIGLDQRDAAILERLDFDLKRYRVDASNKLLPVLRRLLRQNDALLMLPRQSIYNRDTLKGVLLTSYRNRKPAISYSPAHVKSGALASIYSSPVDIGRHLAQLINRKLQNPDFDLPPYQYARFYSIATNRRVARALGIDLPAESKLRRAIDRLKP